MFLFSLSLKAQIIAIPDTNFKNALLNHDPIIDLNSDNEIQQSEAESVTELYLNNFNISSLVGIQSFINLTSLECNSNNLTILDISNLVYLEYFSCNNNNLTAIVLPNTLNEVYLDLSSNELNNLDLSGLDKLYALAVQNNNLTSLSFNNPNYTFMGDAYIDVSYNPLVQLDMSKLRNSVDTFGIGFESITISDTELTDIIMPLALVKYIYIGNNPNLNFLSLRNGTGYIWNDDEPCFDCDIEISNNPNLTNICVDDFEYDFFTTVLSIPDAVITTYCSFTPGGEYNTITGNVTLGCGSGSSAVTNQQLNITNSSDGGLTQTNSNGNYSFYASTGSYSVSPLLSNPSYFNVTPASYNYNFSTNNNQTVADFCLTPNGIHHDVTVSVIPISVARPGFDAVYRLEFKNIGNQTESGNITLEFEEDVLDVVSASPNQSSFSSGLLMWSFTNLSPFESRSILVTMNVNAPTETPPVNNGDILGFNIAVDIAQTDETPGNNTMDFNQIVVGSYDPNDKTVVQGSQISINDIENFLYYVVRFQNTGSFLAENVVIRDFLSSKLNLNTLEIVASSHPFRSALTQENKLEVFYEGINLPPSATDEMGSQGFVAYKIRPKNDIVLNDVIDNTADIYFDYNFPIVTNTVSTTVTSLSATDFNSDFFTVYPNPTESVLHILLAENNQVKEISINNVLGQQFSVATNTNAVDVSTLSKGIYFITVSTNNGISTQRFIKN